MDQFIHVMKSLSERNRVKIIKMLQQRSLCACEIQAALGVSEPAASSCLKNLEEAGLLTSRNEGLRVNYYLADGSSSPTRPCCWLFYITGSLTIRKYLI